MTTPQAPLLTGKPFLLEQRTFDIFTSQEMKYEKPAKQKADLFQVDNIAVIDIIGPLSKHASVFDQLFGMTSYDTIAKELEEALADESINGILFNIDSPGGEVSGIYDLADKIYAARDKKPIWAVANDEAFSAAYAIASSAEKVFLSRTGGVGSIGVIASHIDQSAFDEKMGVKVNTIFAGQRKNDLSPHEPLKPEAAASLQKQVDRFYDMFVALVSRNRKLTEKQIRQTEAGLFYGDEAVSIGLADDVITLHEAINLMQSTTRSLAMSKKEPIAASVESPIDVEAIKQEAFAQGQADYRQKVMELSAACSLAKMPEKLESFLEQNVTLDAAKNQLMQALANNSKQEITSHVVPLETTPTENPVIAAAKARS